MISPYKARPLQEKEYVLTVLEAWSASAGFKTRACVGYRLRLNWYTANGTVTGDQNSVDARLRALVACASPQVAMSWTCFRRDCKVLLMSGMEYIRCFG